MGWGRDQGSETGKKKLIPDPDPGVKKSPDPGFGSATLVKPHHQCIKKTIISVHRHQHHHSTWIM
jgi:hypothetical protein